MWTTPRTWVTSELVSASLLNTHLRDDMKAVETIDYVEITSNVSVTATTEGTANTVITGTSQAYAAEKMWVEFWCPEASPGGSNQNVTMVLLEGSTVSGQWQAARSPSAASYENNAVFMRRLITPSAATFSWVVKAFINSGTGTIYAGAGGSGAFLPAYLAVTRASKA